jgi:hypothetical protein
VARPIDEPIPPDEWLYMGIGSGDIDGTDRVLPSAVDLQGQSVNRAKYRPDPLAVISAARGDVAAAGVQPRNLPVHQVTPTGVEYSFHADDLPEDANDAHAEVTLHRPVVGWKKSHGPSPANKSWLKELLARQFRVVTKL